MRIRGIMDKEKTVKRPDLGGGSIGGLVAKLALPAIAAQLVTLLYNLADRIYVGAIEGAGTEALAALGVVFPITLIVSAFGYLVGLGGAPIASMRMGEGRTAEANKVLCNALVMLLAFGVFLSEGIADAVAGVITALTFLFRFSRILKKREEKLNCDDENR